MTKVLYWLKNIFEGVFPIWDPTTLFPALLRFLTPTAFGKNLNFDMAFGQLRGSLLHRFAKEMWTSSDFGALLPFVRAEVLG